MANNYYSYTVAVRPEQVPAAFADEQAVLDLLESDVVRPDAECAASKVTYRGPDEDGRGYWLQGVSRKAHAHGVMQELVETTGLRALAFLGHETPDHWVPSAPGAGDGWKVWVLDSPRIRAALTQIEELFAWMRSNPPYAAAALYDSEESLLAALESDVLSTDPSSDIRVRYGEDGEGAAYILACLRMAAYLLGYAERKGYCVMQALCWV